MLDTEASKAREQVVAMRRYQLERTTRLVRSTRGMSPLLVGSAAVGPGLFGETAWRRVLKSMPAPLVKDDANRVAAWRVLKPHAGSIEAPARGPESPWQAGTVAVGYLVVGRSRGRPVVAEGAYSLVFSDHALAQAAQAGAHDLATVMLQSHDTLLAAPVSLAPMLLEADSWVLPSGPGGFLIRMRGVLLGDGDAAMLATASDWIPTTDFTEAQHQQAARMVADHAERTLGERWLLPAPMRPVCPVFSYPGDVAPAVNIPL